VMLAQSAALRQRLRSAARSALAHQSWDRVVARFEADLLDVIPRRVDSLHAPAMPATTFPRP
ncbi:MAG TPA: hypothetical protein VEQ65_10060, partial [Opitutus sp.]|nr:hypothetical protein [Opitutus sp.]